MIIFAARRPKMLSEGVHSSIFDGSRRNPHLFTHPAPKVLTPPPWAHWVARRHCSPSLPVAPLPGRLQTHPPSNPVFSLSMPI